MLGAEVDLVGAPVHRHDLALDLASFERRIVAEADVEAVLGVGLGLRQTQVVVVDLDDVVGAIVFQARQRASGPGGVDDAVARRQVVLDQVPVGIGERHLVAGEVDASERVEHQRNRIRGSGLARVRQRGDLAVDQGLDVRQRHAEREGDAGLAAVIGSGLDVGLVGVLRIGLDGDVAGRDDLRVLGGDGVGDVLRDVGGAGEGRGRRIRGLAVAGDGGRAAPRARIDLPRCVGSPDVLRDARGARHRVGRGRGNRDVAAVHRARVDTRGALDRRLGGGRGEVERERDPDLRAGVVDRLTGRIAARHRRDVDVAGRQHAGGALQGDVGIREADHDRDGQAGEIVQRTQHRLDGAGEDHAMAVELLAELRHHIEVDRLRPDGDVAAHDDRAVDRDRRRIVDRGQVVRHQIVEDEIGGRRLDRHVARGETVGALRQQLGAGADVDGVRLPAEQEGRQCARRR